jgi:hypothetical protein
LATHGSLPATSHHFPPQTPKLERIRIIAMTSHLVKAFDRRRAAPVLLAAHRPAPHLVLTRKELSIMAALEWAFAAEHASLDFDEVKGDNARPGVSPLWTVMQRGALGCTIDGGGWNPPAHDADIIASTVAHLPAALGGRRMALRIAELARAGQPEDWGADLRPRCIPKGWKCENQFGPQAATEVVEVLTLGQLGRQRQFPVLACPVTYTASATTIARTRATYHAWCEALAWLATHLRARPLLDRITITAVLPDPEPWAMVGERRAG